MESFHYNKNLTKEAIKETTLIKIKDNSFNEPTSYSIPGHSYMLKARPLAFLLGRVK